MFLRYYKAVDFLNGLYNLPNWYPHDGKQPARYPEYIKRMRYFLDLVGAPDKKLKIIHIAGTSGKGSVSNLIHSALVASEKRAGLFTTPFVSTMIEEFKVGDLYIAPDEFAGIVEELMPLIDQAYRKGPYGGPSHYEIRVAIALLYFVRQKCEYAVLEVGLGGEFDGTNAVFNKVATALTNVGYDHTEILGNSLSKIAKTKAGIARAGIPLFCSEENLRIRKVIQNVAKEHGAHVIYTAADNRALAAGVCRFLGLAEGRVQEGFAAGFLPARFEVVKERKSPTIVVDGAHNEDKIANTMARISELEYKKLIVVFGAAQNKNAAGMLAKIFPVADSVILTRSSSPFRKFWDPHELARRVKSKKIDGAFLECTEAYEKAVAKSRPDDLILITGSFFLAGELRKRWYPEEWILKNRRCR